MSTQYESLNSALLYPDAFRVSAPATPLGRNIWPRQLGVFVRQGEVEGGNAPDNAPDDPPETVEGACVTDPTAQTLRPALVRELVTGQFGLVPRWVKSASDAKLRSTKLVNARSETVTTSTNFRDAWLAGQRCIVPLQAFIDEDWRSGKAVPTRIARVDGQPMGVAGLWERWTGADGQVITSYCLLTVNANSHALMSRYQSPGNEKRMPAILNEGALDAWLSARPDKAKEFMRAYPANWLLANPVEKGR